MNVKKLSYVLVFLIIVPFVSLVILKNTTFASVSFYIGTPEDTTQVADSIQLLFLLSIISLAPTILVMFTSFTRFIISMHFLRSALGTQQMPPNQILVGLALFLTFFLMSPVFTDINENALKPLSEGEIGIEEAFDAGLQPIRKFMLAEVEDRDVVLFYKLSGMQTVIREETPNRVLMPAFILGELTKGFRIGFVLFLPFLVIDMVVASTLMAMGMMMLPPAMISLPFKILLFVMVNGWNVIVEAIFLTFRGS